MSVHTVTIDISNFESEVLKSAIPVVLDFWAPWCGPCRMIGPVLDDLAARFDGRVKVGKINVDDEPDLAGAFQIRGIPTVYALQGGQVVRQVVGFSGAKAMETMFQELATGDQARA